MPALILNPRNIQLTFMVVRWKSCRYLKKAHYHDSGAEWIRTTLDLRSQSLKNNIKKLFLHQVASMIGFMLSALTIEI